MAGRTTPIRTSADAASHLAALVQAGSAPEMTDGEVDALLDRHRLASEWAAATDYGVNARVQVFPSAAVRSAENFAYWQAYCQSPFGVYFRALSPGVSGASEPDWCRYGFVLAQYGLSDGGVLWQYDGLAACEMWDFDAAAYAGWMQKAGKVAGKYDFSRGDQKLSRSQMYDHCLSMANSFSAGSFFVM